jgi:outer membrane receptor protein involved in Fe transport
MLGAALVAFVALAALFLSAAPLAAQGVTTAAVSGTVTDGNGAGLENLNVTVLNDPTGFTSGSLTDGDGDYFVSGLPVGGPYTITVSGLGFATEEQQIAWLNLGQRYVADFTLEPEAVEVAGIEARVIASAVINPKRTGAEQLISERQLATYPTISNNFTDAIQLSPLVGGGAGATAVGSQNNRFNNIQIDGQVVQDLFGLGATGQPGGQADARAITMSAVKEYQVLAAPFDVRQSGFTGGLINAVTKSGTNDWRGAAWVSYKNEDFVRDEIRIGTNDVQIGEFSNRLLGANISGPIIEDRAHFFAAVEMEDQERPSGGIAVGREAPTQTGINPPDIERFAELLREKGVDPEELGAWTIENPNRNVFGRIDVQLAQNHVLTVRDNWVRAEDDNVQDRGAGSSTYSLQSNGYFFETETNSFVTQLNSTFGNGMFNELTAGWTRIRDSRTPRTAYPVIQVTATCPAGTCGTGTVNRNLRAGAEFFSQGNSLDQDSYEVTDNFSFGMGDNRITLGFHDEFYKARNLFAPGIIGQWNFPSLDAFEAGQPSQFQRSVPAPGLTDLNALPEVNTVGVYGQTEYTGIDNVVVTAGLRYDVPVTTNSPPENPAFTEAFPGRTTEETASGNGILSPRLGFNWDVNGDASLQVRGGAGVFTGRFPYVWLSNIYTNTGLFTVSLNCTTTAGNLPAFTLDPSAQPDQCLATDIPDPPTADINLIDPDFEFPHAWKLDLGVDKELPYGIVGTVEFLLTRQAKQIFLRELNVDFENPISTTQGGRPVFGTHREGVQASTVNSNSMATPNRISTGFIHVIELTNSEEDRSWNFTLQGQKRYSQGVDFNASYTLSDAEDVSGLTSSIASSNIGFNFVPGSPNDPPLVRSNYETRHKVVLSGAWDVMSWLTWSMFYIGHSGDPYNYTYDGDVNADGFEAPNANNRNNDLLYVPSGPGDITLVTDTDWDRIDAYISGEECLNEARGQILERNSCVGPWRNRVDTRLTFKVPTIAGQRGELTVSVFNFLNLLNKDWGEVRGTSFSNIDLLELRGWDVTNNRGIFRPAAGLRLNDSGTPDDVTDDTPNPFQTFDPTSRWQAQIGLRYAVD